jgi:N-acetyl-gamma-glutamyl-phosphate reductase
VSVRIGIVGGSGYVGSELLRWSLLHPELEVASVVSTSRAGQPVVEIAPGLAGHTDLVFEPLDAQRLSSLDAVFLATPHGTSAALAEALAAAPVIVDCAADHRHAPGWVYGQPEWHREQLAGATRIAAPGCFATAIELALAPLVAAGVAPQAAFVTAATGSTGSGATPRAGTHHPERFTNLRAYKVLAHQHVPEIRGLLGGLGTAPAVHLVPVSAPVDRGILASVLVEVGEASAAAIVADAYAAAPLVRLRAASPELRWVRGTAHADIAVHQQDGVASVLVAIDNLGKGAAAQAVQALNLALGLPEAAGLHTPSLTP